jgi:queuine tRNA-ribosyltransferase
VEPHRPERVASPPVTFELLATDGAARRGTLVTPHGVVDTPAFLPVGTRGTVKSLTPDDLREVGAQIVLGNTYHLMLRPGGEVIGELGGLHRFMGWDGPILTDSGGFQVWSLAKIRTITEEGVAFRSPIDGSAHFLSPERSIEIQAALGGDIIHPLDECLAYPADRPATERSLELTLRWARRSQKAQAPAARRQALFGIVQGGAYADVRERAARETVALGFDGYAIGGMAVGEPKAMMYDLTECVAALLPPGQPRYLMGVGKPDDLVESVARGVDLFDCVLPTRNARNGQAFTAGGPVVIKQARYVRDPAPIDGGCGCYTCRRFSRAYVRHLFVSGELLAYRLLTLHNLHFFLGLLRVMREAIEIRRFGAFRDRFLSGYQVSSQPVRPEGDGGP